MNSVPFPSLVQRFFTEHLRAQRNVSPQTVATYRDTFRLFLPFLSSLLRRSVDQLDLASLSPEHVLGFLDHLERQRGNCVRTRNVRLAALRCFTRFALAHADPEFIEIGQRILAIPLKRAPKPLLGFLTRDEINAILTACDDASWSSRRDRLLFTLLYNTGARISEVIALRVGDVHGEIVQLHGKGRKNRAVPLWPQTRRMLHQWYRSQQLKVDQPLFTNTRGVPLTRAGVSFRLARAVRSAIPSCPSLQRRGISPHTFRHSTALHLLKAGVALEVIALWLGHESPVTTHSYIEADLDMKARVLRSLEAPSPPPRRRRTEYPRLLAFLEAV
jgi:site-specific recombinase XerD